MNDAISRSNAISRSAALSMMNGYIDMAQDDEMHHAMCVVAEGLAELPALDVAPVVHARWRWKNGHYECTACGGNRFHDLALGCDASYCARCGARMDGEVDV